MVEKGRSQPSVAAQCRLPSILRSSFYHGPAREADENLMPMQVIDRQSMETPFLSVRRMTWHHRIEGHAVNPKCVRRPLRIMGPMASYRKPNIPLPGNRCSHV
ncbi:MAG: hypothetical protein ACU0CO_06670 [Shimia sp.]